MSRRAANLLMLLLALWGAWAPCAFANPVMILRASGVPGPIDPALPTPPDEYNVPAIPGTLAALESGKTVIDVANASELTSLTSGGTVDGTTLAAAVATGPVVVKLAVTTYTGSFTFPALGNSHQIYVVSANYNSLPPSGTRTQEADRVNMPLFKAADNGPGYSFHFATLHVAFGAQKYRFIGLAATYPLDSDHGLGLFVAGKQNADLTGEIDSSDDVPTDIIVDRCEYYGRDGAGYTDRKGVNFDVDGGAIVDSRVMAIAGNSSDDPMGIMVTFAGRSLTLENLEVTASGENIIIGGTDGYRDVHTDIVLRKLWLHKPRHWFADDPSYDGHNRTIKNLLELKKASRVLIEDFVLEDCGDTDSGQSLSAFVFTVRNQDGGDPNAVVENVEVRNGFVRRCGVLASIIGEDNNHPSLETNRIYVHDVLYYDQNYYAQYGSIVEYPAIKISQLLEGREYPHLRFEHITCVLGPNGIPYEYGNFMSISVAAADVVGVLPGFVMKDNIFEGYAASTLREAVVAQYVGGGWPPAVGFATICAGEVTSNNLATGEDGDEQLRYPAGNFFESTASTIGFTNYAAGTVAGYKLASGSYRAGQANDATDGEDMGADIDAIVAATANTISGAGE